MSFRSFLILAALALCFVSMTYSQRAKKKAADTSSSPFPGTDIILVSMRDSGATFEIYGKPVNITHRKGYDNQPAFWVDGKRILYTSIREDQQADIYAYDIVTQKTERLTKTPESEYSPTPMKGGGKYTVIRVEKDSAQTICWYPIKGGEPKHLYKEMKMAAYHCWADDQVIMLAAIEKSGLMTFRSWDMATDKYNVIRSGIGRCLAKVPNNPGVSFTQVEKDTNWLWVYDLQDKIPFRQVDLPQGTQDYAWAPHRALVCGSGSELLTCRPPIDHVWHKFADLSKFGIKNITRIAASPKGDMLAIVVQDTK